MARNGRKKSGQGLDGKLRQVIDPAVAKALSHPLRSHILVTLGDRVASPNEIAKELGLAARDLDYHVKVLVEVGMIQLARAEKRRGVKEHFYELRTAPFCFDDQEWDRVPAPVRSRFSDAFLRGLLDEVAEALRAGTFHARSNSHESRMNMLLDEQGWEEMARTMEDTLERVAAIRAGSAKRLRTSSQHGIPTAVFLLGFETAAGARPSAATGRPPRRSGRSGRVRA
ncbi:MAG TPA: winged helix-turn-helix domain-containing protein [Solirubrobacterales bacterium]|nr:winged helix-turn-helix domain-containing protein [Solirubrobacterales bacterium]